MGWDWCTHHDAHWQTVLEPLSIDEAFPDLIDAAIPDGIRVWIRVGKETL